MEKTPILRHIENVASNCREYRGDKKYFCQPKRREDDPLDLFETIKKHRDLTIPYDTKTRRCII